MRTGKAKKKIIGQSQMNTTNNAVTSKTIDTWKEKSCTNPGNRALEPQTSLQLEGAVHTQIKYQIRQDNILKISPTSFSRYWVVLEV